MPRRKLSEYRAKKIIANILELSYAGWSLIDDDTAKVKDYPGYVVKVDQAVKGRFKKGLVLLNVKQNDLKSAVGNLQEKGYGSFLVEPYVIHDRSAERYLSITHDRTGYQLSYSDKGGVDIESNGESIESFLLDDGSDWGKIAEKTGIQVDKLHILFETFKSQHFTLLEINPYVINDGQVSILDIAIEVDDAGMYFADAWNEDDIRAPKGIVTESEQAVRALDAGSPASFNLSVLNPDGAIFLLLSGGGASIVIADEVYNVKLGKLLANYGEYSGNPTAQEAHLYTRQVLKLLLASKASKKVLFVGGAVANFTDIANTFSGVIAAIDECADKLKKQKVKVYVRRGGPRQEIGLAKIKAALEQYQLLGGVYDPSTSITDALGYALEEVK